MSKPQTAEEAWQEILDYARQPGATIETAGKGSDNSIWAEPGQGIIFQKDDGMSEWSPVKNLTRYGGGSGRAVLYHGRKSVI